METRTWPPHGLRTGELVLIHASKRWTEDERELLDDPVFKMRLTQAALRGLWDFDAPRWAASSPSPRSTARSGPRS